MSEQRRGYFAASQEQAELMLDGIAFDYLARAMQDFQNDVRTRFLADYLGALPDIENGRRRASLIFALAASRTVAATASSLLDGQREHCLERCQVEMNDWFDKFLFELTQPRTEPGGG